MLLIAALIWGTAFVAQSKGMDYVEPFTYNAVRTLLGGIVLIPVVLLSERIRIKADYEKSFNNRTSFIGGILCGFILFAASSFQQYSFYICPNNT